MQSNYRYTVCLLDADGKLLREKTADMDWEPAIEWSRFVGVRQGKLSPGAVSSSATIEPVWHATSSRPFIQALHITVTQQDGRRICCQLPNTLFASVARSASVKLVEQGLLQKGETFRYLVAAYPNDRARPSKTSTAAFRMEEVSPSLPLKQACMADFGRRSVRFGQLDHSGNVPVFVHQRVLDETAALARQAGALETGGILIGHLHQDADLPELFVEVSAQIPARHTHSELMRLTFTPDTWSDVSATIQRRDKQEIMLGWWHSHSYLKQDADAQADEPDVGAAGASAGYDEAVFLSEEDLSLHRTCFPRAYSLALLLAEGRATGLTWALYGWHAGVIVPRDFQILPAADWSGNDLPAAATGEPIHAH